MSAQSHGVTTIMLPERMDSVTASSVEQTLQAALARGAKIIVDGHSVTYMSAAGVRCLAGVLHGAQAVGAEIVFCRFGGAAADCLDVSGFSQLLDIAATVEEALARLESSPGRSGGNGLRRRATAG